MNSKVEYLNRFISTKKRIKAINNNIIELRLSLLPSAIRYDKDRVQTSPSDQMLVYAERLDDMERKLNTEVSKLNDQLAEIEATIKSLDDNELISILEQKYIFGKSYEQIGVQLNYSSRTIKRKHWKAIDKLNI